jgi:hypothetical protein
MAPPRQIIVNAFFEQLIAFLGELKDMYPDDPDFALGLTSAKMMRTMNPTMLANMFFDNARAYESEILTKNEKFFLDHSFSNVQDADFNLLDKLKQYVRGMSDASKKNVWIYVDNLYKLAKILST